MAARETDTKTRISNDGLRYTAKKPGSIFGSVTMGSASATMSCFKCGQHRPVSELVTKKILGRNQKVCAESCQRKA